MSQAAVWNAGNEYISFRSSQSRCHLPPLHDLRLPQLHCLLCQEPWGPGAPTFLDASLPSLHLSNGKSAVPHPVVAGRGSPPAIGRSPLPPRQLFLLLGTVSKPVQNWEAIHKQGVTLHITSHQGQAELTERRLKCAWGWGHWLF